MGPRVRRVPLQDRVRVHRQAQGDVQLRAVQGVRGEVRGGRGAVRHARARGRAARVLRLCDVELQVEHSGEQPAVPGRVRVPNRVHDIPPGRRALDERLQPRARLRGPRLGRQRVDGPARRGGRGEARHGGAAAARGARLGVRQGEPGDGVGRGGLSARLPRRNRVHVPRRPGRRDPLRAARARQHAVVHGVLARGGGAQRDGRGAVLLRDREAPAEEEGGRRRRRRRGGRRGGGGGEPGRAGHGRGGRAGGRRPGRGRRLRACWRGAGGRR
mmetsp:Transcript_27441/g.93696  ORF Transcript_27441/g.93696 Transcript_27441/m.93696 type:complete len:272 (+) Transcript_27441:1033-1848(+)